MSKIVSDLRKHILKFHRKAIRSEPFFLIKRLWHRCFPVNFANFLRTPFYRKLTGDFWIFPPFCENISEASIKELTHFIPHGSFYTPSKHQITRAFNNHYHIPPYIEISQFICSENQLTVLYMRETLGVNMLSTFL